MLRLYYLRAMSFLWFGLLTVLVGANSLACVSIGFYPLFPMACTDWIMPRARYAKDRCLFYCEEVIACGLRQPYQ